MDLSPYNDPFATILGGAFKLLFAISFLAVPTGWILAGIAQWRPLPHFFSGVSHLFVLIHIVMTALFAVGAVVVLSFGGGVDSTLLGFLLASASGIVAWSLVARRSRPEEVLPSLL